MKISIGILAWNEENSIAATLASLARQTLLKNSPQPGLAIEVIVVPNGCSDGTAAVARHSLDQLLQVAPTTSARVEELPEGSKIGAWNAFVHRFADTRTDYFILMDADIELLTDETLEVLWRTLHENSRAIVSTDVPVKHLVRKSRLTLVDRVLLLAGSMTRATPGQLTGQLYCARGDALRAVTIPRGLIVEDGFLKQILCTRGFSQPVDNSLIVQADGAGHTFECYTRWRDIWNHQVRQAVGHTLFTYLMKYLREHVQDRPVFSKLRELCATNPSWFQDWVREEVARQGW